MSIKCLKTNFRHHHVPSPSSDENMKMINHCNGLGNNTTQPCTLDEELSCHHHHHQLGPKDLLASSSSANQPIDEATAPST